MLMDVTCEKLLSKDHPYRRLRRVFDERAISRRFSKLYSKHGAPSVPVDRAIRALVVQYWQDYSDRQMESALKENIAVKWYCGYELGESTPDHSYFGKLRTRLGTKRIGELFEEVQRQLQAAGMVSDVFQFVDATAIITKNALWEERDRAIGQGYDKLNNQNVEKFSADKDARFGCRGKDKFFFGYKRHVNVDMGHGMVTKVAVTPGNVPDGQAVKHVLRDEGMVFGDKAYCTEKAQQAMRAKGCHSGAIKKHNMRDKDQDHDRWLTRVRMPYEGVFSKKNKRARYRGWAKVQAQAFLEAIAYNLKRALVIDRQLEAVPATG